MLKNSPKVIKDKHRKQDFNKCLIRHWRNRHKYEESKKKESSTKAILEFCINYVGGGANDGHMKLVRECVSKNAEN